MFESLAFKFRSETPNLFVCPSVIQTDGECGFFFCRWQTLRPKSDCFVNHIIKASIKAVKLLVRVALREYNEFLVAVNFLYVGKSTIS